MEAPPLHHAAQKGRLEVVEFLVVEQEAYLDEKDNDGQTPLYVAAVYGSDDVAEFLVFHGASIDERAERGWTALQVVCSNKN
jgi:ankyrin repeat protein